MPPNPRDGHRLADGLVTVATVRDVIADALAVEFPGHPDLRDRLGALVLERLAFFGLLAQDVDVSRCVGDVHVMPHKGCILR